MFSATTCEDAWGVIRCLFARHRCTNPYFQVVCMRTCKQCKPCSSVSPILNDDRGSSGLTSAGLRNCEVGKKTKVFKDIKQQHIVLIKLINKHDC